MRSCCAVLMAVALAAACSRAPEGRQFELTGQIVAVEPPRNEVTIRHEAIQGFMPAMTMPFKVRDAALLADKQPGDLVNATLVVEEVDAYLTTLTTTGHVPLETPSADPDVPRILAPGDEVADAQLVGEDGEPLPFSSLRGHRVAVTFIYTRCPLPEFCPMMDRHFAAVQKTVSATPSLGDVRLLTVTFDPEFDTPAILQAHARRRGANPAIWRFATGDPGEVSRFASQFGVYIERNPQSPADITHNLITVVVGPDGRLVTRHTGNDWTPTQLVADLEATPAPSN